MTTATRTQTIVTIILHDEDYYEDSSEANTQDCSFTVLVSPEVVMKALAGSGYELSGRATDASPYVAIYTYLDTTYDNAIAFVKGIED